MNCNQCVHRVRADVTKHALPYLCTNKRSKKYLMTLWDGHPKCDSFEFNAKGAKNG